MPSLEIWQQLLATEAPIARLWPLIEAARAGSVLPWDDLSPAERDRGLSMDSGSKLPENLQLVEFGEGIYPAFAVGDVSVLDRPKIGIVGTRRISSYGKAVAELFAQELAQAGCTVVSGGAIGIDSVAHSATLEVGGKTVCVLPSGVDVASPPRHAALFARISQSGCLLSRFACGAPASNQRLIHRNHFLAQVVDALVAIEAPEESGTLITALAAQKHGKPVFVVPGPITQGTFRGSHNLIRSGAELVDSPSQVLEALGILAVPSGSGQDLNLEGEEATIYGALYGLPQSPEQLSHETGIAPPDVLTALTMLEIQGIIVRTHDGYARKS